MNEEKHIEEMAYEIEARTGYLKSTCYISAETLYNAGYRKQSVGEWVDQYNRKYANPIYVCSLCGKGTLLTPYINELNNMEMTQALSSFCPHCGARMKGGAE